jgi:hypothetical protein
MKGNMQQRTEKKKEKDKTKEIKPPDLTQAKDAKGGYPPDPCGLGGRGSLKVNLPAVPIASR